MRYDGTGEGGLSHASTLPIVQWFRKLQLLFGVIPRCSAKDAQTMLRHMKPDTAQINYSSLGKNPSIQRYIVIGGLRASCSSYHLTCFVDFSIAS